MTTPYYEESGITIYHGDCREILPRLPKVDLVMTDPPYGEHLHSKQWIGSALTSAGKKRCSTAFKELGFASLTLELQAVVALESARMMARWGQP